MFHAKTENTVWLCGIISALVASNWSQITFFILARVLMSISERFWPNFDQIDTSPRLTTIWRSLRPVQSRGKMDCRELLEVHRNVIDVKSIAFLMTLLASEVSFVTLHMRWHKGCCSNSIHKNKWICEQKTKKKNRKLLFLYHLPPTMLNHTQGCPRLYHRLKTATEI